MLTVTRLRYNGVLEPSENYEITIKHIIPELKSKYSSRSKSDEKIKGGFVIDDALNFDDLELLESAVRSKRSYYRRGKVNVQADIDVLDIDTIMELRHKLQIITGIPLFRQHLFMVTERAQPLYYKVSGDVPQPIDIRNIEGAQVLAGIPIGERYSGVIISHENFNIVGKLLHEDIDIFIVDLDDFLTDRVELDGILQDKYNSELIYESFIMPYFPMMDIDMFREYVQNPANVHKSIWPETRQLRKLYEDQNAIYADLMKVSSAPMLSGITSATLLNEAENSLNLRNIFDLFKLSCKNRFMQCKTMVDGHLAELRKNYNNAPNTRERVVENTLMITIELEYNAYHQTAQLIFDNLGNMQVRTGKWRDDLQITQDMLYDILEGPVNDVIAQINSHGRTVSLHPIIPFSRVYTRVVNVNLSLFYKATVGDKNFDKLKDYMTTFVATGLLANKPSDDVEFYLRKGIFRFNPTVIFDLIRELHNSYSYLYNSNVAAKWAGLYEKNRLMRVQRRYTDVKFELYSVREEEQHIIVWLIRKLISKFDKIRESGDKTIEVVNKLRKLRQLDPVLYDNKDAAHGDDISKKCQKPLQPNAYTVEEFTDLGKDPNSIHVMKYHNITTGGDLYYECTNPKFPYPRFIVDAHPQGYCIPCCKKIPARDLENKRKDQHEKCMVNHKYDPDQDDEDKRSRYVVNFNSYIDPGRLAHVPNTDLGVLFHKNEKLSDEECRSTTDNMLMGVPLKYGEANMGVLYSAALVLEQDVDDLFERLIAVETTISALHGDQATLKVLAARESITPWDQIILAALDVLFSDIRFIVVDYTGDPRIDLPEVHDAAMFLRKYIVILIKRDINNVIYYNPVVYINKDEFFNNGNIIHRVYSRDSWLHKNFIQMVEYTINSHSKANNSLIGKYDLGPSDTVFVSVDNIAYAIYIKGMYIPVAQSYYTGPNATTKLYNIGKQPSDVVKALKHADISTDAITEILVYDGKPIGARAIGMNWYGNIAGLPSDIPKLTLLYNPIEVNKALSEVGTFQTHPEVNTAFRQVYEYDLVKGVVMNVIYKHKNKPLRDKLRKVIDNNDAILAILEDYPEDKVLFRRMLARHEFLHGADIGVIIDNYSFSFDRLKLSGEFSVLKGQFADLIKTHTKQVKQHQGTIPDNYVDMSNIEITGNVQNYADTMAKEYIRYGKLHLNNIHIINGMKFQQNPGEKIHVSIL